MSLIPSGSLIGGDVPFKLMRHLQFHKGVNVQTMTGPLSASYDSAQWHVLDPGGSSRDFVLPSASGSYGEGRFFLIKNGADSVSENIDLVDEADVTVCTINAGGCAVVIGDSDGTWYSFMNISGTI